MGKLLFPIAAIAIVLAAYRTVAELCRRVPGRRPWFIASSLAGLTLAGLLVPWFFAKLDPPWSESPSGLLIYLGKGLVVGGLGLSSLGMLLGALWPGRPRTPG